MTDKEANKAARKAAAKERLAKTAQTAKLALENLDKTRTAFAANKRLKTKR